MKNDIIVQTKALFDKGDFENALKILDPIIEKQPKNYEAYHLRGLTFLKLKKYEEALFDFSMRIKLGIIKKDCADAEILIDYGYCYFKLKDYENAIGLFTSYIDSRKNMKKIDNNIKFALALKWRGRAFIEILEFNKAIADFETSIQYNNRDLDAFARLIPIYAKFNEVEKAIEKLTQAIELTIELKSSPLVNFYVFRAELYVVKNLIEKAISDYKQCTFLQPDNPTLKLRFIQLLKKNGRLKEAKKELQRCKKLENLDDETKKAIEFINHPGMVCLSDPNVDLQTAFLVYQKATTHFEQGITNLEYGIESQNKNYYAKATVFFQAAKKEFEDSKNLLENCDNSFDANNNLKCLTYRQLGIAYFHLQNYSGAIFNFSLASELDDWCHLQRAICFFKINMIDPANVDFLKGCELALIRIYQRNNQIFPLVEKEREIKTKEFIDELINFPEKLKNYFAPDSMTHTLLHEAIICYKAANKTEVNKQDKQSIPVLVTNGLFKAVPKNRQETDLQTNLLSLIPQNEQEVEAETNLWVMD